MPWWSGPPSSSDGGRWLDAGGLALLVAGLLGCFASALAGCGGEVRADLLDVRALDADRVEPGTRIELSARGLPAPAEGELRLEGMLSTRTGPRPLAITLPAEIVSEVHAEVLVTGAQLDELVGERGTLVGRATLVVPMAGGAGELTGTLEDVRLDLMPAEESSAEHATLGERIGLLVGREDERMVVRAVEGAAARWGVLPGDVLVAVDGLQIRAASDLAGWPELPRALVVERAGSRLTLGPRPSELDPAHGLRVMQLAALLAVLALLLRARPTPPARPARKVIAGVLAIAAGLALVHALLPLADVDRFAELLGPASFVLVLSAGAAGVASSPAGAAGLGGIARGLGAVLALLAAVASVTLAAGVSELSELAASQSLWPVGWALLGTPIAPALLVLLAAAMPAEAEGRRARLVALGHELALLAVVVPCLAGGPGPSGPLGALAFVGRGLVLLVVLRGVAGWLATLRRPLRAAALALGLGLAALPPLAALGLTPALLTGALSEEALGRAAAEVWAAALALGAVVLLLARPAAPDPELAL